MKKIFQQSSPGEHIRFAIRTTELPDGQSAYTGNIFTLSLLHHMECVLYIPIDSWRLPQNIKRKLTERKLTDVTLQSERPSCLTDGQSTYTGNIFTLSLLHHMECVLYIPIDSWRLPQNIKRQITDSVVHVTELNWSRPR